LTKPYRPSALLSRSKFTTRIAQAPFPPKLKMVANVGKYDGSTDPDDHIGVFVSAGTVEGWTILVWCHMFVQTLIGSARSWYDSLPCGEINSLEDLLSKFMKHFSQQKRQVRSKT
jgi:hypothetical protein